jgi:hypothetical protein
MDQINRFQLGSKDNKYPAFTSRQLTIFSERARLLADRVGAGQLRLVDAADMLQTAAELSGLAEMVGDDTVQAIMVEAFMRRRADA